MGSFMEKYIPYEKQQFRVVFEEYDDDGSGEISILELKEILTHLGFMPLRAMIQEALQMVDQNGNGQLDFDELVKFLSLYRRAEGFTTKEVADFHVIFDRFSQCGDAPGKLLPGDQLCESLCQAFGLYVHDYAEQFQMQIKSGQGLQKSSFATSPQGAGEKLESLNFREFLIFARKTREAALEALKTEHPDLAMKSSPKASAKAATPNSLQQVDSLGKFDADGDGVISEHELRAALKKLGFTPLKQNIDEILGEVDKNQNHQLDFHELFDFMLIYRQREGFRKQVVEDMRRAFDQFDQDGSGEVSVLELSYLFRHLGYKIELADINQWVIQVDLNGSNQLDFREYLQLMRMFREDELRKISHVFNNYKDESNSMPLNHIKHALADLQHQAPSKVQLSMRPFGMDFDAFVGIVDSCRTDLVARERKKAGFTDERIQHFQEEFDRFDKDHSGEIDTTELMCILKEFNWEPKTKEEQATLLKKIALACERAGEAKAHDKPDSTSGTQTLGFWEFVQLARILQTDFEQAEEEQMMKLGHELNFTSSDIEGFRNVFAEKKQEMQQLSENPKGVLQGLPRIAVIQMVKGSGMALTGENKAKLDSQLAHLGLIKETSLLDFPGFLRLMRWVVDNVKS